MAAIAVALAVSLRLLLEPVVGFHFPFATLFLAVLVCAWYGGFGPAMFGVVLGALLANYLLLPPLGGRAGGTLQQDAGMVLYLLAGVGIAVLGGSMHAALRQTAANADRLRRKAELIDQAHDAMLVWNWDGPITFWNRGAERLYGFARVEALGRVSHELLNTALPVGVEALRGHLERTGSWEGELQQIARDGRQIIVESRMVMIREGATSFVIEADRDITGRCAAESALRDANDRLESRVHRRTEELAKAIGSLRASEKRLAGIIDSAMDAIVTVDTEQRITVFNTAAEQLFGYKSSEVVGQTLRRLIPAKLRDAHDAHVGAYIDSGSTRRRMGGELGVIRGLRADGTEFPIEASLSHTREGDQRFFTAILRDVSERVRLEQSLRDSRSELMTALEAGGMGTWRIDLEKNCVDWSDTNLKLWGRTREELGDGSLDTVTSFVHPEDRAYFIELRDAAIRTRSLLTMEFRIVRSDGTVRWLAARGKVQVDAHDRPTSYSGVALDITERRAAEELRLRSQKLESLGTLSGGIAHDFNNILLAVAGNTKLAIGELPPDHPAQECLVEISKAASRATDMVRQILAFSRPQEPNRKNLELRVVVEEALRLVRATLPSMIAIHAEFDPEVPAIAADPTQIHQIIVNLATNAAHAIGRSGKIALRVDAVIVGANMSIATDLPEGRYARLAVSDDGCGMDRETLARIFDPFFTTKPVGEGTGLGLSVVHGIMKSHNGAITAYSRPGSGTTFHLYFPAASAADDVRALEPRVAARGRGERVLYVDDDEAIVFLASRVLTRLGYAVSGFTDPVRALEEFRACPGDFDAAVSDLSMPGLPGFELARELLAIRPDLPIIMTSGHVSPEDQAEAKRIGARAVILKPDTIDLLAGLLDKLFRDGKAEGQA